MEIDRGTSPPSAASRAGSGGGGWLNGSGEITHCGGDGAVEVHEFRRAEPHPLRRPIHHIIPLAAKTRVLSRPSISSRHVFELTEL